MGILDSKSRIMDVILTSEGRRQKAEGTFRVSFATFSDNEVGYKADGIDGHVDPVGKIYLEACNLPQDQVIFEANDEGNIIAFRDDQIIFDQLDSSTLLPKPLEILFEKSGKPSAYQLNFGPRLEIRKPGIDPSLLGSADEYPVVDGTGIGFSITDSAKKKANFILDPSKFSGVVSSSYSSLSEFSSSYYIGIQGGINARDFTTLIQATIFSASQVGPTYPGGAAPGPHIESVDRDNYIYLTDTSGSHDKVTLSLLTGSGAFILNSSTGIHPFVIENSFLGGRKDRIELPNADFASKIVGILTSSFDNFKEIGIISSIDSIFQEDRFDIFPEELTFDLSQIPNNISSVLTQKPSLNSINSLFADKRMTSIPNFKFLPPIAKSSEGIAKELANFSPLGNNTAPMFYKDLLDSLKGFIKKTVNFENTTRQNNLLCQLFDVNSMGVNKLDIIDYGFIRQAPGAIIKKRVYFVGKVFLDDRGTACFTNIFTLVFSQDSEED